MLIIFLPIVVLGIVLYLASQGKDKSFTITAPPLNTAEGKLVRIFSGIAAIALLGMSLLLFNSTHNGRSNAFKIITALIFVFSISALVFFMRRKESSK